MELRFPNFEGRDRITTMFVHGGLEAKTFRDPTETNGEDIRKLIEEILHLPQKTP